MIVFGVFFILVGLPTMIYLRRNRRLKLNWAAAFAWALAPVVALWFLIKALAGLGG